MIVEDDMRKRLNLVRMSPTFVLQEVGDLGKANVLSPAIVPKDSGIYWIAGTSIFKSGRRLESVFRIDTDGGGSLASIFWWIKDAWYRHEDEDALILLGLAQADVFPMDWQLAVPLEEDIFHP